MDLIIEYSQAKGLLEHYNLPLNLIVGSEKLIIECPGIDILAVNEGNGWWPFYRGTLDHLILSPDLLRVLMLALSPMEYWPNPGLASISLTKHYKKQVIEVVSKYNPLKVKILLANIQEANLDLAVKGKYAY